MKKTAKKKVSKKKVTKAEIAVNVAEETLISDLMEVSLRELKSTVGGWDTTSERDQADVIFRTERGIKDAVRKAVAIIASQDCTTARATIDQVVFKDGVKIVLKMSHTNKAAHAVADKQGSICMIVIPDAQALAEQDTSENIKPDKDQKELPL